MYTRSKVVCTQCGNFRILLSLRFYVKSIFAIVEMQNLPFSRILTLNFDFYEFGHFWKAEFTKSTKLIAPKLQK